MGMRPTIICWSFKKIATKISYKTINKKKYYASLLIYFLATEEGGEVPTSEKAVRLL